MAEIIGMTAVYTGGPVPSNNGRVGVVLGTVRNGWVDVQFDGDASSTKCAPDFLHPVRNSPARVAALDMLGALKKAEAHIDRVCGETTPEDLPEWFADLRTIRAAIAKAEGRTS